MDVAVGRKADLLQRVIDQSHGRAYLPLANGGLTMVAGRRSKQASALAVQVMLPDVTCSPALSHSTSTPAQIVSQ
jgi:hypothetical protein